MAILPLIVKQKLENVLRMGGDSVLNLTNPDFAHLIKEIANIDIYNDEDYTEYSSNANVLRQIIEKGNDAFVGKVLNGLLNYWREYLLDNNCLYYNEQQEIEELMYFTTQMMGSGITVELPQTKEETLQTLLEDINSSLSRNQPTLVLDRLHTFSTKYLRQICLDKGIVVTDPKGIFLPLHSLAGMLRKHYESSKEFQSEFTVLAIQNNIQLFDKFNNIRNNQSYAHDNQILSNIEADFVIKAMANILVFIDKVENLK